MDRYNDNWSKNFNTADELRVTPPVVELGKVDPKLAFDGLQQRSIGKANPLSRRTGFAKRPSACFHMGDRVLCDQLVGLFRRCRCGSENFTVMEGIGPHAAQLRCECCGLGGRWLARHNFG